MTTVYPDPTTVLRPVTRAAPFFVDGHLDLAHNALERGRDLTLPLDDLRQQERATRQTALVTLPELRRAGVGLVFGTLFALPANRVPMQPMAPESGTGVGTAGLDGYTDAEGAHRQAVAQLAYYRDLEERGWIRIIRSAPDLEQHLEAHRRPDGAPLGVVLLMEGADPIREPDEADWWWAQGLRIVGLSWQATRYAGGTNAPGPVTDVGRELLRRMDALGMALDLSHLSEAAIADCFDAFDGPVLASHSNARAITNTDRHLDDGTLAQVAERNGVVGIVLANVFLDEPAFTSGRAVGLNAIGRHARHLAGVIGWDHVGIGSDFDGGFGVEETPVEITRGTDFGLIASAMPEEHRGDVLGGNWLRWLARTLPTGAGGQR